MIITHVHIILSNHTLDVFAACLEIHTWYKSINNKTKNIYSTAVETFNVLIENIS
jgi:hypothetical protein